MFWVADLTPAGDLHAVAQYAYADLERLPGAIDLIGAFSSHLWRSPDQFEASIPGSHLHLRWRACSPASGIATLRSASALYSLSILLSGADPQADRATLEPLQQRLLAEFHDTGIEPSLDLANLQHRPVIASLHLRAPQLPHERAIFAINDRCFAASFFRKLGMA